ncbi:LOW QUALITY PROTEIN: (S)-N-methylcoclaurine 3'-hydroxylase isozyme 1-like [Quercus suber]|uniref:LOW QUALITY PROTEIN: (S)-N-methylcoclaurine 3'-hydroxylase isozyme 1-like n=1 Tax=Quercus suber TaxID=58331 RepID=UPI0032DF886C
MKNMAQTSGTEGSLVLIPLLVLPLLFLILRHFKILSSPFKSPLVPPGPNPWPIIGNILQLGNKPHVTLTQLAKNYGPLISLRLGTKLMVVGSSPDVAKEILKTHDRVLSGRHVPNVFSYMKSELDNLSLGWALECSGRWKFLRTLCRAELFSGKALESQACLQEKKVKEMVELLGTMEGKVVNIGEVIFATVFNMLSNVLLSSDFISLKDESMGGGLKELIRKLMEVCSAPNVSDFFPILGGFDLQGQTKKALDLIGRISFTWADIIKERRERKGSIVSQEQDFLDVMIDNNFTDKQINQLLLELFSAGTDTSSSTIEWAMAELIKNPESMKKVQEELAREIKQDVVKEFHLPQLSYLQASVKETLRLHPPAPLLLPHRAIESYQVTRYTIPKDSQVLVNVWAIGRDPMYWEDPLVFKPERFLKSALDFKGNDFEFLPFSAGRRICPGLPMAAKVVPLVLASLIHNFDWSIPHGCDPKKLDMSEKFGVTLQKEQPLYLIPEVRK